MFSLLPHLWWNKVVCVNVERGIWSGRTTGCAAACAHSVDLRISWILYSSQSTRIETSELDIKTTTTAKVKTAARRGRFVDVWEKFQRVAALEIWWRHIIVSGDLFPACAARRSLIGMHVLTGGMSTRGSPGTCRLAPPPATAGRRRGAAASRRGPLDRRPLSVDVGRDLPFIVMLHRHSHNISSGNWRSATCLHQHRCRLHRLNYRLCDVFLWHY